MDAVEALMRTVDRGLVFANLVDFDTLYGHRNDVAGYARTSNASTRGSADLLPRCATDDLLVITADHGNDPTTPSTDHAREYVPLFVTGRRHASGVDSASARPSPTWGRRWPSCSASRRSRTGTSFRAGVLAS